MCLRIDRLSGSDPDCGANRHSPWSIRRTLSALTIFALCFMLNTPTAHANKVKKLNISALSPFSDAPEVVVYSLKGEKWDVVDETETSKFKIGMAESNDHVYAWYSDGTVSSGSSGDLDRHRTLYNYTPAPGNGIRIEGIGIAGSNDRVYVMARTVKP